ncbi:hypothetical protein MUK42_28288 [Musa troglodytarum]|uniref:Uncharacterized protein n=1 Tax=Musa troglodytarum TaxID=320322 RepID=A0A9E7FSZ9_9LILI|nr:hypothetical protein MUK42_28288 [Musa troglodytarum]
MVSGSTASLVLILYQSESRLSGTNKSSRAEELMLDLLMYKETIELIVPSDGTAKPSVGITRARSPRLYQKLGQNQRSGDMPKVLTIIGSSLKAHQEFVGSSPKVYREFTESSLEAQQKIIRTSSRIHRKNN